MSKKIIILPGFASSHLLKCSIQNWIDVLAPDVIINIFWGKFCMIFLDTYLKRGRTFTPFKMKMT